MAINVRFMTHVKRENSTLLPTQATIDAGITLPCVMLEDTSIINPTFKISYQSTAQKPIMLFNYCWCDDFRRYYFIDDIISSNGFWYISCTCDALASFKTYVGAGNHFVLRSASQRNQYIIDTSYLTLANSRSSKFSGTVYEGETVTGSDPFAWGNGHSYVLGIIGNSHSSNYQFGSVCYYWFDDDELTSFINYLMNDVSLWSGIGTETYSAAVQAALLNPVQYIVSAIALPFSKPTGTGDVVHSVKFGYYNYTPSGAIFNPVCVGHHNIIKNQNVVFTIPKHPQASQRGAYMNSAAYSSYTLHLGPFGDIPLDPALLMDETQLNAYLSTDVTHGTCRVIVRGNTTSNIIYQGVAQVGVSINLSSANRDIVAQNTNMVNGIIDTVGAAAGAATGNLSQITNVISTPINTVVDATKLKYPQVLGGGEAGSFLTFHDIESCYLLQKIYMATPENIEEAGRPLYQKVTINTLSGFILCSGADCRAPATHEEIVKINNYMNTGFYYE